mmetsp:Transcript_22844/g.49742  ORF Transcript_22844/g.49742 Transcript_22844/m.49742 type:complete len:210 (+) Transcript_22844:1285-1914(+)
MKVLIHTLQFCSDLLQQVFLLGDEVFPIRNVHDGLDFGLAFSQTLFGQSFFVLVTTVTDIAIDNVLGGTITVTIAIVICLLLLQSLLLKFFLQSHHFVLELAFALCQRDTGKLFFVVVRSSLAVVTMTSDGITMTTTIAVSVLLFLGVLLFLSFAFAIIAISIVTVIRIYITAFKFSQVGGGDRFFPTLEWFEPFAICPASHTRRRRTR